MLVNDQQLTTNHQPPSSYIYPHLRPLLSLRRVDENTHGQGFVDWHPFTHPQLGEIEVGGIDAEKVFRNPPLHLLEKEIAKHADFIIFHALISPLIAFRDLIVEKTGEDTFKIRAVVAFGTALGPAAWIVARNISTKTEGEGSSQ